MASLLLWRVLLGSFWPFLYSMVLQEYIFWVIRFIIVEKVVSSFHMARRAKCVNSSVLTLCIFNYFKFNILFWSYLQFGLEINSVFVVLHILNGMRESNQFKIACFERSLWCWLMRRDGIPGGAVCPSMSLQAKWEEFYIVTEGEFRCSASIYFWTKAIFVFKKSQIHFNNEKQFQKDWGRKRTPGTIPGLST